MGERKEPFNTVEALFNKRANVMKMLGERFPQYIATIGPENNPNKQIIVFTVPVDLNPDRKVNAPFDFQYMIDTPAGLRALKGRRETYLFNAVESATKKRIPVGQDREGFSIIDGRECISMCPYYPQIILNDESYKGILYTTLKKEEIITTIDTAETLLKDPELSLYHTLEERLNNH